MSLATYVKSKLDRDPRSQQAIAEKINTTPSNLSKIANGINDNPQWITMVALMRELGGSLDEAADLVPEEKRNLEHLVGAQAQRIEDQRAIIENQQRTFDFRVNDYEKRLADKDAVLAERQRILQKQADDVLVTYKERLEMTKNVYEARLKEHKDQLQRERDRSDSLQRDIARIRMIDSIMTVGLVVLAIFAIYLTVDSLNGAWGLIRY